MRMIADQKEGVRSQESEWDVWMQLALDSMILLSPDSLPGSVPTA